MKFLSEKKYDELHTKALMVDALDAECKRLAALISSETKDCKMGPWCKDCQHRGKDIAQVHEMSIMWGDYVVAEAGEVIYCKKHLHEICPEYERRLR